MAQQPRMVTITDIKRTQKGRYSIFLDEEFYCALHEEIFAAARLQIRQEIALADMERLWRSSELKITKDRALRLLSQREYASGRLRRKLLEYSDEEAADQALERMEELGLLDDADYARRYIKDCYHLKGYSRRRTEQALMERGVPRETARTALDEAEYDPHAMLLEQLRGRYARRMAEPDGYEKVIAALMRRGFGYGDIRSAMEALESAYDEDE